MTTNKDICLVMLITLSIVANDVGLNALNIMTMRIPAIIVP